MSFDQRAQAKTFVQLAREEQLKPVIMSLGEPTRGWLLLATASTLAGNLTMLGSVSNVIVVEVVRRERVEIGFAAYCQVGIPLTILTLLIGWVLLVGVPV